jgi:hypothetical protein
MEVIIGICPICDREMWVGKFIDKHHFLPKCKGGRETKWLHKVCHRKIHSIFTNTELAKEYNNPELVRSHPEIEKFIKWISKKDPNFYDKNTTHNKKGRL